jgi:hypothetical protein
LVMRKLKVNHKIKKQWKQPTLIRLVRGSREENVLVVCKVDGGISGPDNDDHICGANSSCGKCNIDSVS